MELDRETKFGVILSRSVSPSPDRAESTIGPISPKKNVRSFYRLPNAAVSEPLVSSKSFEAVHRVGKSYRPSPLIPQASHSPLGIRDSPFAETSFADVGAATAMSSRNSSTISLPILAIENINSSKMATGRRHVHLKTTMRKEVRPERVKGNVTGPQSMTEAERKRYEGVWASNYYQEANAEEQNCLDNLIVRELWLRSNLQHELLGHIWYEAGQSTFLTLGI